MMWMFVSHAILVNPFLLQAKSISVSNRRVPAKGSERVGGPAAPSSAGSPYGQRHLSRIAGGGI